MSVRTWSSAYWMSVMMVAANASAMGAARAQNAAIVPRPSVHAQSASGAVKDATLFHLTVINILGQRLRWLQGDPGEFAITLLWPRVKTKGPRPCSGRGPSIRTKTDCGRIRSSSRQWQHQGRQE